MKKIVLMTIASALFAACAAPVETVEEVAVEKCDTIKADTCKVETCTVIVETTTVK